MAEKDIATGLCPGGHLRLSRLRLLETGRIDPTPLTTHTFKFNEIEKAYRMMEKKEDGIIKPLIRFEEECCKQAAQSGSRGFFSPGPHTTWHAGPHQAVPGAYRAVAG